MYLAVPKVKISVKVFIDKFYRREKDIDLQGSRRLTSLWISKLEEPVKSTNISLIQASHTLENPHYKAASTPYLIIRKSNKY